jgi:hypothetical protein
MATATVLGLIYESPIIHFIARTGPGTNFDTAEFKVEKGTSGLTVLDVQPDDEETKSDFGRNYQWFHLQLPDGRTVWLRDHVVGIEGDFGMFGYGFVAPLQHAYLLARDESITLKKPEPVTELETPVSTEAPVETPTPVEEEPDETKRATREVRKVSKSAQTMRPSGPPMVTVRVKNVAHTREGSSTVGYDRVFTIPRGESVPILDIAREERGQHYRWFKVEYQGRQAWIREDLVAWGGDTEALGLPYDLYPSPMRGEEWWVRGYNYHPYQNLSTWEHWGWDFGAMAGTPIYTGPNGGRVVQVLDCAKCTPHRPSTVLNDIPLGATFVYGDEGWGFGYGNFVVIAYDFEHLPASTQGWMDANGYTSTNADGETEGTLFVLYAHLQSRAVQQGRDVVGDALIGTCGNTGNSEAPHLHLEVRAAASSYYPGWAELGTDDLVNPIVLFNR